MTKEESVTHKKFDTWKEAQQYLLDNMEKSCINCKYGNQGKVQDMRFVFCTDSVGMVHLDLFYYCNHWKGGAE